MNLAKPRLRLYTKPAFYGWILRDIVWPYGNEWVECAETELCKYTGAKHAIATSMGRTAIYEGLRALLKPGDEIILSPLTVPEIVSMVMLAGLRPIFCDIKVGTWNLDPSRLPGLLTGRTRAVMTTHLYGITNTAKDVSKFCSGHDLCFIEDAAQALGAHPNNRSVGTFGDFGILSFSYPKNLTSFYGGMIITNNNALAQKLRGTIAKYPEIPKHWYYARVCSSLLKDVATSNMVYGLVVSGLMKAAYLHDIRFIKKYAEVDLSATLFKELPDEYASRMSGIQGRILCAKMPEIDMDTQHRVECSRIYNDGLSSIPGITCPPASEGLSHSYLYYPVQVADVKSLMLYMIKCGRDVARQYIPNCADLQEFKKYYVDCPNARYAAGHTLMLPTYPKYPLSEVQKNTSVIQEYYAEKRQYVRK